MKELYEVYWTLSTEKLRDAGQETALLDLNVPQWSVAERKLLVHSELEPCLGQNQALAGGQDVALLCHSLAGFLPHPPHSVRSTLSQPPPPCSRLTLGLLPGALHVQLATYPTSCRGGQFPGPASR